MKRLLDAIKTKYDAAAITGITGFYYGWAKPTATFPYITFNMVSSTSSFAVPLVEERDIRIDFHIWHNESNAASAGTYADSLKAKFDGQLLTIAGSDGWVVYWAEVESEQGPLWEEDGKAWQYVVTYRYRIGRKTS